MDAIAYSDAPPPLGSTAVKIACAGMSCARMLLTPTLSRRSVFSEIHLSSGGSARSGLAAKRSTSVPSNACDASDMVMPMVSRPISSRGRNSRILACLSSLSQGGSVSVMCVHCQGVDVLRQASHTSSNFWMSNSVLPLLSFISTSLV
jgi:hypothetical protein